MGLSNFLALSTDMTPAQALRLLVNRYGLGWGDEAHLIGPALWVGATSPGKDYRSMISEGFGFSPDLLVGFRLDPNADDYEEGNRIMMRATLLLLEHGRDGVLLFNGERIILQRLGGQLTLNADYGNWTAGLELEAEISVAHDKRSLPSPI